MRIIIIVLTALLEVSFGAYGQSALPDGSPVAIAGFTEASINIGLFPSSDSIHAVDVWLRNDGNAPLTVTGIYTSCGCTIADCSSKNVCPGDSTSVSITYNGHEKWPGPVDQGVLIQGNAVNSPVRLRVIGYMYDDANSAMPDSTIVADWPVLDEPVVVRYELNDYIRKTTKER